MSQNSLADANFTATSESPPLDDGSLSVPDLGGLRLSAQAPMDALPDELLENIIELTLEPAGAAVLPPSFTNTSNVWLISHISPRFRSVVLGMTSLWANVKLNYLAEPRITYWEAIEAVHERANGPCRLTIAWNVDPFVIGTEEAAMEALIEEFEKLGSAFLHKISHLSIYISEPFFHMLLDVFFGNVPDKFFNGIEEIALEIDFTPDSGSVWISPTIQGDLYCQAGSKPPKIKIKANNLTSFWEQTESVGYDDMTIMPPMNANCPLIINIKTHSLDRVQHLSLTGTTLILSPIKTCRYLYHMPNLRSFAAWITAEPALFGSASFFESQFEQPYHRSNLAQYLKQLDLTLCGERGLTKALYKTLDQIRAPLRLTHLSLSRYHRHPNRPGATGLPLHETPINVLDSENVVTKFIGRAPKLRVLDLKNLSPVSESDVTQLKSMVDRVNWEVLV